jgi:histidine phosphotransferase ChpT
MTDQFTLASILCSRLCHDLVNPVGAVNNGIEILVDEDDPEMQKQVLNLLEQSTRQVSNRLQFFRLAFGAASGMQQSLPVDDLKRAAEAFFAEGKVTLDWQPQVSELTKDGGKVLLNLVLVAGESLIRGGSVTVLATSNGGGVVLDVKA